MTIPTGTHQLSEANGDLLVYTTVEGPAAALGHHLILRPATWQGTLTVGEEPAGCSLEVEVDASTIAVYGSRGGAKAVSPGDRKVIDVNIRKVLASGSHPLISFRSSHVDGSMQEATVTGELTIRGRAAEQQFRVKERGDGVVELEGEVTQTRFGITPFSTMIGTMRLGDDVTVKITLTL